MPTSNNPSSAHAAPSLSGEGGGRGSIRKLIKILLAVLTAIAGTLGISAMA